MDGRTHGAPYRGHGSVPLRFVEERRYENGNTTKTTDIHTSNEGNFEKSQFSMQPTFKGSNICSYSLETGIIKMAIDCLELHEFCNP